MNFSIGCHCYNFPYAWSLPCTLGIYNILFWTIVTLAVWSSRIHCFFLKCFHSIWKVERETHIELLPAGSLHRCSQQSGLSQSGAWSPELNTVPSCGNRNSTTCAAMVHIIRKLELNSEPRFKLRHSDIEHLHPKWHLNYCTKYLLLLFWFNSILVPIIQWPFITLASTTLSHF